MIQQKIFREYDIRGVFPEELNSDAALVIGKAFGSSLRDSSKKKVAVGADDRRSSPELLDAFVQGLVSTGCAVTDIGVTITPIVHFLTCTRDFDAGVVITASHNPAEYNGFRIDYRNAVPMYGVELQALYKRVCSNKFVTGEGVYEKADLNKDYVKFYHDKKLKRRLRVVVDCGYGSVSAIAKGVFETLGVDLVPISCELNSGFPKGLPNPEDPVYIKYLSAEVKKYGADIGFAFDTDADRLGVVDENGTVYTLDKILMLFVQDLAKVHKGFTVIYDVKCSGLVEEVVRQNGGMPSMIRTGHPFFMLRTKEKNVLLGTEFSGHVFFKDKYYGYDDGVYAAYRLLAILDESGKSLSSLMSAFPRRVSTPEIKVLCPDARKAEIVAEIIKNVEKTGKRNVVKIDGARVATSKTGWYLIRASNTAPYLSVRAEGKDDAEVNAIIDEVVDLLRPFGISF